MDDLYSFETKLGPIGPIKKTALRASYLIPALILVTAGAGAITVLKIMKVRSRDSVVDTQISTTLDPQMAIERQLVTFAGQFLMNYYNYSYTLYSDAVKRSEAQMTPELQAVYAQRALDREFIGLLEDKQVSTDGFRITPNSILFAHNGKTHYVQLSGTMTYTTEVNGAQAEWPTTVLLEILETDQGFMVNNVQRQR
jgi:hypothetical protein